MEKRGSIFRIIAAIFGGAIFLVAFFYLDREEIVQAMIFGGIGLLLITIAFLPLLKGKIKK